AGPRTAAAGGTVTLTRDILLDCATASCANYLTDRASLNITADEIRLNRPGAVVLIDTLMNTDGHGGDVTLTAGIIQTPVAVNTGLKIDTSTPSGTLFGGDVTINGSIGLTTGHAPQSVEITTLAALPVRHGKIRLGGDVEVRPGGAIDLRGTTVLTNDVMLHAEGFYGGSLNLSVMGTIDGDGVNPRALTIRTGSNALDLSGVPIGSTERLRAVDVRGASVQLGLVRTTGNIWATATNGDLTVGDNLDSQANEHGEFGDGNDGGNIWLSAVNGNLTLSNGVSLRTEGARGLDSITGYFGSAGWGGWGGQITLQATGTGSISLGSGVSLLSLGGDGGNGTGVQMSGDGVHGGSAGRGGNISITASNGLLSVPNGVQITSQGGKGGNGYKGANGVDGLSASDPNPGEDGGHVGRNIGSALARVGNQRREG
ncbi:MAG: hypothetical protein N2439_06995, partial [Anaerolineae bacterium]|nr:hypothetical protein [Anaerolineae bacterium]